MKKLIKLVAISITITALSACSNSDNSNKRNRSTSSNQSANEASKQQNNINIMGAGSSFIYPVMSRWANSYYKFTNNSIEINYQPIGSGGGQRQVFARTVSFGASDQPLDSATLKQNKLIQFPMIVGGIVLVINIPGIKPNELVLDGHTLANIYLGKVQYWDDASIKKLNPNLKLPHNLIIAIHRSDGSGTTYNFANYLAKVSSEWKNDMGVATSLSWSKQSNGIGGKGNAGVAAQVSQLPYSIGYVEYAYAAEKKMNTTKMVNADGNAISPNLSSFQAASKNAYWSADNNFYQILTNQPGEDSWPIDASTFILLPTDLQKDESGNILKFFKWVYHNGSSQSQELKYVSIPSNVTSMIGDYISKTYPDYTKI